VEEKAVTKMMHKAASMLSHLARHDVGGYAMTVKTMI
jgi:hypothetical protein